MLHDEFRRIGTKAVFLIVVGLLGGAAVAADLDGVGDPLPAGAVFRLGTVRFRQEGEVQQLAYNAAGDKLASVDRDTIVLWDANTARPMRRLARRRKERYARDFATVAFSPDGEEVAAADSARVYVWEVETGLELLSFSTATENSFPRGGTSIAYSPDGKQLAVGGDSATLTVFSMTNGRRVATLTIPDHRAAFYDPCWSPDGRELLAGSTNPAVVAWNVKSADVARHYEVKKGNSFTRRAIVSGDGKTLLAASANVVHLWNYADGRHRRDITVDSKFINRLALSPDQKTLVVGSQDGIVRIVDVATGKIQRKLNGRLWLGRTIAVTPDFQGVALGAVFPTIRQWEIPSGRERFPQWTALGHDAAVHCVAASPDGKLIASGGSNQKLILWDARTGEPKGKLPTTSSAYRIQFDSSGRKLLASWRNNGVIRIWDVASGKEDRAIDVGFRRVRGFQLTPDGKTLIAVCSGSKSQWHSPVGQEMCQIWDFAAGKKLREFSFPTASTESVTLLDGGKRLVTGAANGLVHVLDTNSGFEVATLSGHGHSVNGVTVSSDGKLLASGGTDQRVCLWDTRTWKRLRVFRGHRRSVTSVVFSPDGRRLASGSGDAGYPLTPDNRPTIRVWDVATGKQVAALSGHDSNTSCLAFSPGGIRLISGHDDTTVLVWQVK